MVPQLPDVEHELEVRVGLRSTPTVDLHQLVDRLITVAFHMRSAEVLDAVAGGAQRDEVDQSLNARLVVVLPDFVALDRVGWAAASADLATRSGTLVYGLPEAIPLSLRDVAAHVRIRHELDRQSGGAEAIRKFLVQPPEFREPGTMLALPHRSGSVGRDRTHDSLRSQRRRHLQQPPTRSVGHRYRNNAFLVRIPAKHLWPSRGKCTIFSCMSQRSFRPRAGRGTRAGRVRTQKRPPTRVPRSPKRADLLSSVLASGALARLVTHFAVRPDETPHMRALQRHTGLTPRSLQIELARLERLGIVERRAQGRRVGYILKESSARWRLLRQLVRELADPVDIVRDALSDVPGLDAAFVFGSFARGDTREDSDLDLLVLEDGAPEDLVARRTLDAAVLLGREVNIVQLTRDELRRRIAAGSGFFVRVLDEPKVWIIGDERLLADRASA